MIAVISTYTILVVANLVMSAVQTGPTYQQKKSKSKVVNENGEDKLRPRNLVADKVCALVFCLFQNHFILIEPM